MSSRDEHRHRDHHGERNQFLLAFLSGLGLLLVAAVNIRTRSVPPFSSTLGKRRLSSPRMAAFSDPKSVIATRHTLITNPDSTNWWVPLVEKLARPFGRRTDIAWCTDPRSQQTGGIWYVKTPKAASSAGAALTHMVAENLARRLGIDQPSCRTLTKHWMFEQEHPLNHNKELALMWTTLREPAERAKSEYFHFFVTRERNKPNPFSMKQNLLDLKNFQTSYVAGTANEFAYPFADPHLNEASPEQAMALVDKIMDSYDFIAITERMDESLVVMKLLFGWEDEDIVNMPSSKHAGGFDDGGHENTCFRIQQSFSFPEVDDYIAGDFRKNNIDYLLYEVAHRSLDLTIESLGKDLVAVEIEKLKRMQQMVSEQCEAEAIFPCTEEGPPNPASEASCYYSDVGCGHKCVQDMLGSYKEEPAKLVSPNQMKRATSRQKR